MTQQRLRTHNVVGVFGNRTDALHALDELRSDFEPRGELSLLGPDIEMRPGIGRLREHRGGAMSGLGSGLLTGAVAGTVGGSILMIVAVLILPVGLSWPAALALGAAIGAIGGGTVGSLFGVEAAGRRATMWQQTLSPMLHRVAEEHVTLLGIHVDDDERAQRAREVLSDTAQEVRDLKADVDYQPEVVEANIGDRVPSGSAEAPGPRQAGMEPSQDDRE